MDFSKRGNWMFRPEGKKRAKAADVFFVYPTVYAHPKWIGGHNMNPKNPIFRFAAWFLTVWRSRPFTGACNLFTPHYRQAGIEILDMTREEAWPIERIAAGDIKDAFYYYLEHLNEGRPFILAGHSQGATQILELIITEFKDAPFLDRFVAAYVIGFSVTREDLEKHPHLKLVEGEDDLGGVITYNTSAAGLRLMRVVRPGSVCVNPLSWRYDDGYAPKSMNLGSVLFILGKYFRVEKKHFTGAYIDLEQGVVMIDKDALDALLHIRIVFLNRILIHRGTLHMLDIALFHRNLQHNVDVRLATYWREREAAQ